MSRPSVEPAFEAAQSLPPIRLLGPRDSGPLADPRTQAKPDLRDGW
jgi:hypothetical protein